MNLQTIKYLLELATALLSLTAFIQKKIYARRMKRVDAAMRSLLNRVAILTSQTLPPATR